MVYPATSKSLVSQYGEGFSSNLKLLVENKRNNDHDEDHKNHKNMRGLRATAAGIRKDGEIPGNAVPTSRTLSNLEILKLNLDKTT